MGCGVRYSRCLHHLGSPHAAQASTQPEDTESSADNIAELLTVAELRHQLQEEQTARLAAEENVEHLKAMLANQIAIGQSTKPVPTVCHAECYKICLCFGSERNTLPPSVRWCQWLMTVAASL